MLVAKLQSVVLVAAQALLLCLPLSAMEQPGPPLPAAVPASPASQPNERWDDIHLAPEQWPSTQVMVGEIDKADDLTRELLRVQWRQGDPIDLYIVRPTGVKRPPVVVFLYSFPAGADRFRDDSFCRAAIRDGFAAVGFATALTGQRYHNRPMKQWFVSELQESLGKSTHDVQALLNYLASRGDLDMTRVGIFGQGAGGTIAILAAAADSRIQAVDALDPWGDWPVWLAKSTVVPGSERDSYTTQSFLEKVAPLDPVKWLPLLKQRSVRLQLAAFDDSVPESVREHLRAALPRGAAFAAYGTVSEYRERAADDGKILQWLHHEIVGKK
ncbi:MAG: dienelactone hydrolase family protein [Acidobacteriota bacterium]|nr:dienelactone hydrolase family protein [Acidobacteriota bacterium]